MPDKLKEVLSECSNMSEAGLFAFALAMRAYKMGENAGYVKAMEGINNAEPTGCEAAAN